MGFHSAAHHRPLGPQSRERLLLVFATHERAIGIVVLQKGDAAWSTTGG